MACGVYSLVNDGDPSVVVWLDAILDVAQFLVELR